MFTRLTQLIANSLTGVRRPSGDGHVRGPRSIRSWVDQTQVNATHQSTPWNLVFKVTPLIEKRGIPQTLMHTLSKELRSFDGVFPNGYRHGHGRPSKWQYFPWMSWWFQVVKLGSTFQKCSNINLAKVKEVLFYSIILQTLKFNNLD